MVYYLLEIYPFSSTRGSHVSKSWSLLKDTYFSRIAHSVWSYVCTAREKCLWRTILTTKLEFQFVSLSGVDIRHITLSKILGPASHLDISSIPSLAFTKQTWAQLNHFSICLTSLETINCPDVTERESGMKRFMNANTYLVLLWWSDSKPGCCGCCYYQPPAFYVKGVRKWQKAEGASLT